MKNALREQREVCWVNPKRLPTKLAEQSCELNMHHVEEAEARWHRFAAFFKRAYPENIFLEPSALAGMHGAVLMAKRTEFARFGADENTTHLVWATGGNMVPRHVMEEYYNKGKGVLNG